MRGPRNATYVEARVDFRAPLFSDSNNTAYYGDFAGTSVVNVMRANQFQLDGSTYTIDSPSGDVGSIKVDGASGGYAGYMIRDDWGFISDGTATAGIYNDTRNEWSLLATDNGATTLYGNGVAQLSAENGYGSATNSFRSPIYYPPSGTTRFLDLDSVNGSEALKIGGEIFREGFAADDGTDNKFLTAQDQNQWIWNTATNFGIVWATNTTSAYRHELFGDNMISFVGAGNVRASIDLDNGDANFQGELSAGNFALNAGNENISLNPVYGSGLADTTLFDGTQYWEARAIKTLQGTENAPTDLTSEYVKNGDGPFAASYVLRTAAFRDFYSDFISVEPGEEIYGEMWVRTISGTGGLFYYGVERFDKDKLPIAGNTGTNYFVASGSNQTSTSWQQYSNNLTLPTTHTSFGGSDGLGVKYIRIRILMNHNAGGALREFGPPILKRINVQSKISTDKDLYVGGNATIIGDLTVDDIFADNIDANAFRDITNTARYMSPASGANVAGTWNWNNGTISNLNNLTFADPGPNEGIQWVGGNDWKIYESPDDLTTNTGGNLQFVTGSTMRARINNIGDVTAGRYMYAQRFYDSNDGNYYADPASTSIFNALELRTGGLKMAPASADNGIWFNAGADTNHVLWNQNYGGPTTRGAAGSGGFDGMYWNTYQGLRIRGGTAGAFDIARFNTDGAGSGNAHYVQLFANNVEQLGTRGGYGFAANDMRAPIFSDSDDTAYYGDFAGISAMNQVNVNLIQFANGWDIYDDSATALSIRSNNGDNGTVVFRDSGGTDCGRIYFDDDNHWGFKSPDDAWQIYLERNAAVNLYYNGTWEERSRSGFMEARGSYRAPIFYDSNDTAFYANPNATSRFRGLTVLEDITAPGITGSSGSLRSKNNRTISPSNDTASELKFGFTSWDNNNTAPYADYMHMRSWSNASGGSDNLVTFKKSGIGMRIWQQAWGSATAYSTFRNVAVYNENPGGSNDLYASNFYDADDTAYFLNPNSTADTAGRVRGGILHGPNPASKNLLVGGYGRGSYTNNTDVASIGVTNGNLHIDAASGFSTYINFYDGNTTYFGNGANGIAAEINSAGNSYFPISYDRDNSAYYSNPASTSVFNSIDNRGEINNDGWFRNDTSGRGLLSTPNNMYFYSTSATQWRIRSNGATIDLAFANSGNATRGYVYADASNNIGFLNQAGNWALRTNGGTTEVYGNLYADIMYDRDNSTYYVNPGAQSHMNTLTLAGNRLGFINSAFDAEIRVSDGNPDGAGADFSLWGDGVEYNARLITEVLHATRHMRAGR